MKVLIVDTVHPILIEKLEEKGVQVHYDPHIKTEEAINSLPEYEGLIIRSKFKVTSEILSKAKKLRFIGRVGAGMENINTVLAQNKGIICLNSPEGNRDAVGEQALGMLLSLLNHLNQANHEVRQGIWNREKNRGSELKNLTVGLIGYGNMGSAFAEKLTGLGCRIMAYDKYKFGFANDTVSEVTPEQLFEESDVVSLHVPLTEETHYMAGHSFVKKFRKPIILINTARGPIVHTKEIVEELKSGSVKAAALDVLEFEKSSFEELHQSDELPEYFRELAKMQNVILTPHIAGWTHESNRKLSEIIANKIITTFNLQR